MPSHRGVTSACPKHQILFALTRLSPCWCQDFSPTAAQQGWGSSGDGTGWGSCTHGVSLLGAAHLPEPCPRCQAPAAPGQEQPLDGAAQQGMGPRHHPTHPPTLSATPGCGLRAQHRCAEPPRLPWGAGEAQPTRQPWKDGWLCRFLNSVSLNPMF